MAEEQFNEGKSLLMSYFTLPGLFINIKVYFLRETT